MHKPGKPAVLPLLRLWLVVAATGVAVAAVLWAGHILFN